MAQLYFHYASMNAGKSTHLLSVAHNYKERGMQTLIMKPAIDTRDSKSEVVSRIGLRADAVPIVDGMNLIEYFRYAMSVQDIHCVLIDEAQFLSSEHIYELSEIVDKFNCPVICYGLRTDFRGELFEGAKALFQAADKLVEMKGVCHCGRKATMVARIDKDGNAVIDGPQVEMGGEDRYVSLCRKHWKEKVNS